MEIATEEIIGYYCIRLSIVGYRTRNGTVVFDFVLGIKISLRIQYYITHIK